MTLPLPTTLLSRLWALGERIIAAVDLLQPAAQLLARWYIGAVFFRSGLTKLHDWDTTLALFMDEYHVPLIDSNVAAFLGTGAEVLLPVLLVVGLGGRAAAAGLFVLNIVAVASVAELPEAALQGHIFWGSLLAALALWGPGRWSLDRLVAGPVKTWLTQPRRDSVGRYTAAGAPPGR